MIVHGKGTERSYGKCGGAGRGDYCPFAMVVGMAVFGVTGGASPSPYEKRVG